MPKRIARWNPERTLWETDRLSLFSEHSEPFSAIWPTSGSMRSGSAFALPTSTRRTSASGSSSSRSLKTPTANLGSGTGSHHPDLRKQGGHGPTLADEVEHLIPGEERDQASARNLPTPTTTQRGPDANLETRPGAGPNLHNALLDATLMRGTLLPTPSAAMRNDSETPEEWAERWHRHASKTDGTATRAGTPLEILAQALGRTGDPTIEPSDAGSDASDE